MTVAIGAAGPGVANMVPGVMCAWVEGVPLLAIGTQRVRRSMHALRRGRFQFGPQIEVMRPITKFAASVEEARRIPEFVREAFRLALAGRPGPAFLEIPADVLLEEVDVDEAVILDPATYRFAPGAPDPESVEAAAEFLTLALPTAAPRRLGRALGRRHRRAAGGGRAPRRARDDERPGPRRHLRGSPTLGRHGVPLGNPGPSRVRRRPRGRHPGGRVTAVSVAPGLGRARIAAAGPARCRRDADRGEPSGGCRDGRRRPRRVGRPRRGAPAPRSRARTRSRGRGVRGRGARLPARARELVCRHRGIAGPSGPPRGGAREHPPRGRDRLHGRREHRLVGEPRARRCGDRAR